MVNEFSTSTPKKPKNDAEYIYFILQHMMNAIDEVEKCNGTESVFDTNFEIQHICVFNMEKIGEYCKKLSSDFTSKYPNVPWSGLAKNRDVLAHSYFKFESGIAWNTLTEEYPIFLNEIIEIARTNNWEVPNYNGPRDSDQYFKF